VGRKERGRGFTVIELLIVIAMIGTLTAIGVPVYGNALDKARVTRAIADIHRFDQEIQVFQLFNGRPPDALADIGRANWRDPYGNPYEYLNIVNGGPGLGKVRKDHNLVPLNSDYDLYSKGEDGDSKPPLTAKASHDDIVLKQIAERVKEQLTPLPDVSVADIIGVLGADLSLPLDALNAPRAADRMPPALLVRVHRAHL
jgi:general secretion pathway protein G